MLAPCCASRRMPALDPRHPRHESVQLPQPTIDRFQRSRSRAGVPLLALGGAAWLKGRRLLGLPSRLRTSRRILVGCEAVAAANERVVSDTLLVATTTLRDTDVCSFFCIDLFGPCKTLCLEEQGCNLECEVEPVAGMDVVPEWLREMDQASFNYELDGWWRTDPPNEMCDYYDFRDQPEKYTQYDGGEVWQFIHESITFPEPASALEMDFNVALEALHAGIAAHIVADIKAKEDSGSGMEGLSAANEFQRRLGSRPSTYSALRSTWSLVIAASMETAESLDLSQFEEDAAGLAQALDAVKEEAGKYGMMWSEFPPEASLASCRLRFRELCLVMDCVYCNHCRLHGKIIAIGLATAFQVLTGGRGAKGQTPLSRMELGALLLALVKLTEALDIVQSWEQ